MTKSSESNSCCKWELNCWKFNLYGEKVLNEEHDQGVEDFLDRFQSMFDQTLEISEYPSFDSTNTDDDNCTLKWMMVQRIMVPTSTKEKEKVVEDSPKMRPSTRAVTQNLIGNALNSNKVI